MEWGEAFIFVSPGQDERKRSTRRVPSWGGHDVRPSATVVGNCNLGSLSTGSLIGHLRLAIEQHVMMA